MKRHELWRMQYREDPYLDSLPAPLLHQRFLDILSNSTFVGDELKIGFRGLADGGTYWMPTSTHAFEEYARRGTGIPPIRDFNPAPRYDWPGLATAVDPFRKARAAHRQRLHDGHGPREVRPPLWSVDS